jgi:pyruvate/2-oxoacid:ferredoxin oxidoreductase beta subunit
MSKMTVPEIELLDGGHVACQGCGAALSMRLFLKGAGPDTALVIPACCWAVIASSMPNTCLRVPTVLSAFEAAAAVASGLKAGLRRKGAGDVTVAAFAGDGGTADIGIQALSGAAERSEDIIYVCYDNEAYMNTGIQRSGATPPGTWTTTTPRGLDKKTPKKDMPAIMVAHRIPYVATLNPSFAEDFVAKVKKAVSIHGGTRYLHILADCPTGWKHDPSQMVEVGRLATWSRAWPLYEVENGKYRITWEPSKVVPVTDYMKVQGRFSGLTPENIDGIQKSVDERWLKLKALASAT